MPDSVTVTQGDSITSIAFERGFFPDTIWNHAENRDLKDLRKNPNVLFPGDEVYVPDLQEGSVDAATEKRHRFRRRAVPETLRVRFLVEGEPRKSQTYSLDLDGALREGSTDDDGWLKQPIPPNAKTATVRFKGGAQYVIDLGGMDPITEASGVQKRLANLNIYTGAVDGRPSDDLTDAVKAFQRLKGLDPSGEVDKQTQTALQEAAG